MEVEVDIPKHTVIQYVRHKGGRKKNVPYGVIVAVKNDNVDLVGIKGFNVSYSLCNKNDRFSKKMALKIAIGRTSFGSGYLDHPGVVRCWSGPTPRDVSKMMTNFVSRCKKYYKVKDV